MKRKIKSIVLSLCMVLSLFAGMTLPASAAEPEVTISNDLGSSSYTLSTSSSTQTAYNVTVDMDATGLTAPVLKITVPEGFTLNSYPTESDDTLSSSFADSDPFSKSTDENGDTLLTYKWATGSSSISFSINVTPTIQGCYTQDYSVTATLLDDTTEMSLATDTISIVNPTTSEDSFQLSTSSRHTSAITLDGSEEYYVPVAFSASPYRYYLFDKFEITIPLTSDTTPCYKSAGTSAYTFFGDGTRTWVETGTSTSSLNFQGYVTYDSDYDIEGESVPVLIIELFPQSSTVDGHNISNESSKYTYYSTGGYGCGLNATSTLYSRYDIGIYEEYSNPTADTTYMPAKSAQLMGYHDDTPVTLCAAGAADSNYTVTFKEFTWEDHFCLTSTYARFNDVNNSWNHSVQSETDRYCFSTYFFSDIENTLPATDVQLKFTADAKLHCNKILINASSQLTVAPTSMTISYKTINGGDTAYTATVSAATTDSSLWYYKALCFAPVLDDDDGIVEATLTLDRLGPTSSSTTGNEFFRAFVRNADYDDSSVSASLQILGGYCDTSYVSTGTFGSQTAISTTTTLKAYSYRMSNSFVTNTAGSSEVTTLSKGDSFSIVLNNSNYSSWYTSDGFYTEVVDPEYYLLMPSEYIFNGFTPASDWGDVEYTLTTENVTVNSTAASTYSITAGEYILYAVKFAEETYTGSAGLSKSQMFTFTVGPTKDTSVVITDEKIPVLAGFCNDSEHFVDSSTEYADLLDVDSDSDTDETMVFKPGDTITINAAAAFSTYSALTSDTVSGAQNTAMSYTNGNSGSAVVTVNNGSDSTVSDLEVTFTIGKENTTIDSYTAKWDANVTAALTLTDGLAGATVSYSTDNGSNYSETAPTDLSTVTNVKVTLSSISTGISGTISMPFTAAFVDDMTASDYSYIQTSISYNSGSSTEKTLTLQPSATSVENVSASGYSGAYDGTAHGITVNAPTDATVKYGTTSGSYTLDSSPTYTDVGDYTVYYRVSKIGCFAVAGSKTVNISKADQSAPAGVGKTDETIKNKADGTITGVTDKMEYSADNGSSWTSITGTSVTGLAAGTYLVRYAADSNHNAGAATEIVIVAGSTSSCTGTPTITVTNGHGDSSDQICIGATLTVTPNTTPSTNLSYQWEVSEDGSTGWTSATGSGNSTSTYTVSGADVTKYLRIKVTSSDAVGSVYSAVSTQVPYTITLLESGNTGSDAISFSDSSSVSATYSVSSSVTIYYTLDNSGTKSNTLSYSGGTITQVTASGTGSSTYTVSSDDAVNGVITISAVFAHTDYGDISGTPTIAVTNGYGDSSNQICIGAILTATPNTTPSTNLSYQWEVSEDGSTGWTNATGTGNNTTVYTVASEDAAKYLRIKVTSDIATSAAYSTASTQVPYTIALSKSGNTGTDMVSLSDSSSVSTAYAADGLVAVYYTLDSSGTRSNTLSYSGGTIIQVMAPGTGSSSYTVNSEDASNGVIEITAVFNHVNSPNSGGSSSSSTATTPSSGVPVIVNGKSKTAGTFKTTTENGQTQTTVTLDTDKLEDILDSEGVETTIIIPIQDDTDSASGVLTGQMVKDMEKKAATLVVETGSATYTLPAEQIDIDDIADQFGEDVELSDIEVEVTISEPDDDTVTVVENSAEEGGFTLVVQPVEFTVSCTYNGEMVEVTSYKAYVERMIEIPDDVDPEAITTAVVIESDGTVRHVPTQIIESDGVYYAVINSLTNSTYTVVWNPVEFEDAKGHWAQEAINGMGSRMVVYGDESGNYNPDNDMTRAEFATTIVRALGLAPGSWENSFDDLSSSDWYCGYVETAASCGIIKGYGDGSFGPNDTITREQAMTMIARAVKITGLEISLNDSEISELLEEYSDGTSVSDYATDGVAAGLKTGIVSGTSDSTLAPKDDVTRAEAAVMVQRLLQKSELI